jgi:hypothetical protein
MAGVPQQKPQPPLWTVGLCRWVPEVAAGLPLSGMYAEGPTVHASVQHNDMKDTAQLITLLFNFTGPACMHATLCQILLGLGCASDM